MTSKIFRPIFLIAIAALLAFITATRAAIPPAESLLPADTLLMLTVPDFTKLRAAATQSPQWLCWNDPAMKPFHDKFLANFKGQFVAPLERDLGVKMSDFTDLPQGQLTFAITQNGWTGKDDDQLPGAVLLLDTRDKSGVLKTNLAALRKKWADSGKPMRTETIRDLPFIIVPLSSNSVPPAIASFFPRHEPIHELGKTDKPMPTMELFIGQFDSLLIVGSSAKAVEGIVARLTGGALPPLGDNAVYAADALAQFRDGPLYYGWFNGKTLFDVLAHIPPTPPNPDAPSPGAQIPWDKILASSGLAGLKSATFTYRDSSDGAQLDFFLSAPEAGRQGLFKIIAMAAKDANPPAFVPASTIKFSRWRLDGQKAWVTLQKMLADISPQMLSTLNSALDIANATAQFKDPSFDLRKNLFNNLGDDLINYEKAPTGTTPAELNNAPELLLLGAVNPDLAVLAIKTIAGLTYPQDNAPAPRKFLGRTIYAIAQRPVAAPGTAQAAPRSLYAAASGGYVAISADAAMLEEFLRSAEQPLKPLREIPGLAEAAQHVGGAGNGLFGYSNQHELMRASFAELKSIPKPVADPNAGNPMVNLGLPFMPAGKSFRDWLDFSLLPDYNKVARYFYFSVYGGSTTADGFAFKIFSPRTPGLAK